MAHRSIFAGLRPLRPLSQCGGKACAMISSLMSFCLLLAMCGCAGYRLGPSNGTRAGERSVQVQFFENKTLEPRLPTAVNEALRRTLQQDGTFHLDTNDGGDVLVSGIIRAYDREGISFQPGDVLTARDFSIVMTARVTALDRSTGKVLFERDFRGRTTVRAGADLVSAERQALPLLAEDMARNISAALTDGDWR